MDDQVKRPKRGDPMSSASAMAFALAEAKRGLFSVSPNPPVGCVILDATGKFLSSGSHEKFGEAHAEVNALRGLSEHELRGAQLYVTLEPCAHEGKTPSCAKALAKLPLGQVIYGVQDPNPLVAGQGAEIINRAGIPCVSYHQAADESFEAELEEVCEAFLWSQRHRSPFVSLKVASSLDGRIALADGTSRWITSELARERGHELRASHDAILIGSGTLTADDPSLDVRHPRLVKKNKVVVLDSEGLLLKQSWRLAASHNTEDIFWVTGEDRAKGARSTSAQIVGVARNEQGRLDPKAVLTALGERGLQSILVEGGAQVAGAFLKEGLVNRLHLFMAPVILGSEAKPWTQGLAVTSMADRPALKWARQTDLGRDFHLTGLLRDPHNGAQCRDV